MDLRSFWTAPFPADPALSSSNTSPDNTMDLVFQSCQASSEPHSFNVISLDGDTPLSGESSCLETTTLTAQNRRRPMPRKGHKKSRRGCYSCKRRKIKCPETKPFCENCEKAGITCEYPLPRDNQVVLAAPSPSLSPSPTIFNMNDMRFFHHFIVRGYPHLPVGADHTWTMEMPAIAHQYGYLLKAMLALGASHLHLATEDDLHSQALTHRVDAIKMLNQALSKPATSREEADARFATFMILTFQSTCMLEGLFDFLTMLRGCILNGDLGEDSYFKMFTHGRHLETMNEKFTESEMARLDTKTLAEAITSLANIEPLCETESEKKYHSIMTDVAVRGFTSPKAAYESFVLLYNFMGTISHSDFRRFLDSREPSSLLLLSHFLASHILLRHISLYEARGTRSNPDLIPFYQIMRGWMDKIDYLLPSEYKSYNSWPRSFVGEWVPPMSRPLMDSKPIPTMTAYHVVKIASDTAVELDRD